MFHSRLLKFLRQLKIKQELPTGVEVLNPFRDDAVFELCTKFYARFYNDDRQRTLILGINPGRFGAGLTGIPFTDPVKLESRCGIANDLQKRTELSADFIYPMIDAYGGVDKFYGEFHFSSVSPLGFTFEGKNLNYYDLRTLQDALKPFIVESMKKTLKLGVSTKICYCLGEGSNAKYLTALNAEYKWFGSIVALPHPRFIMQYRRKRVQEYIDLYLQRLREAHRG